MTKSVKKSLIPKPTPCIQWFNVLKSIDKLRVKESQHVLYRVQLSFSHWQSAKLYKKTNTNVDTNRSSVFLYLPKMPFVLSISRQYNPSRQHPVITAQKCWYPKTLRHSISPRLLPIQADFKGYKVEIYHTNILATSNK